MYVAVGLFSRVLDLFLHAAHFIAAVSGKFVIGYPSLQLGFVATFKLELTLWSSSSSRFGATSRAAHDTDTTSYLKSQRELYLSSAARLHLNARTLNNTRCACGRLCRIT